MLNCSTVVSSRQFYNLTISTPDITYLQYFNTSIFSEALSSNANILFSNFFIINNFGINIPPGDVTAFTLTSVFTVPESGGTAIDASSYFTLTGNQTTGFNIKTTSSYCHENHS